MGQWKVRCGWAHHKAEAALAPLDPAAVDKADPANSNVYIGNLSAEVDTPTAAPFIFFYLFSFLPALSCTPTWHSCHAAPSHVLTVWATLSHV